MTRNELGEFIYNEITRNNHFKNDGMATRTIMQAIDSYVAAIEAKHKEEVEKLKQEHNAEIHKACEVTPEMLAKSIRSSGLHIFEMSNVQTCDNITAKLRERAKGE